MLSVTSALTPKTCLGVTVAEPVVAAAEAILRGDGAFGCFDTGAGVCFAALQADAMAGSRQAARALLALSALLAIARVPAFYLPGVAPKEYMEGDRAGLIALGRGDGSGVNKLTSTVTQLPYDYYSLPFCKPKKVMNAVENLGEVLHGSVIHNSPYDIFFGTSNFKVEMDQDNNGVKFAKKVKEDYRVQLIMDNLPAATKMIQVLI
ncbi:hypothetical protein T492DRAFT_901541 [Pavlovales sp. CCMP2436]|nr:hypothetical protein T492DRAFT_901541 [Pavlovales sp. CCMP2436]